MISIDSRLCTNVGYKTASFLSETKDFKIKTAIDWISPSFGEKTMSDGVEIKLLSGHSAKVSKKQKIAVLSKDMTPVFFEAGQLKKGYSVSLFCPQEFHPDLILMNDVFDGVFSTDDFGVLEESITFRLNYFLGKLLKSIEKSKSGLPVLTSPTTTESEVLFKVAESLTIAAVRITDTSFFIPHNSFIICFLMIARITGWDIPKDMAPPCVQLTDIQKKFIFDEGTTLGFRLEEMSRCFNENVMDISKMDSLFSTRTNSFHKKFVGLCSWEQTVVCDIKPVRCEMVGINTKPIGNFYSNGLLMEGSEI